MTGKSRPTAERLNEVIAYDPETGAFTWKVSRGKAVAGARAGKMLATGRRIYVDGIEMSAAHVAWFLVNGEWPTRLLRFKDKNVANCAISNLTYGAVDTTTAEGRAAYLRDWRKANPRSQRHLILRRGYGMSLEEYQDLLVSQDGCCAICKGKEIAKNGKVTWLPVDHDHGTGVVRGLLCTNCNHMLGKAKDNPAILRAGADYLDRHASKRSETNIIPLTGRKAAS